MTAERWRTEALELALARLRAPAPPGERPGPALGALLAKVRARAGLSNPEAMRALRRRLRRQVNRWTGGLVEPWEHDGATLDPWLLVEYLEALEAPLETWLELLELLMVESPTGNTGSQGGELRRRYQTADAEQRAEILATLRAWVRAEAEMARLPCQMQAVETQLAALLASEPAEEPVDAGVQTLRQEVSSMPSSQIPADTGHAARPRTVQRSSVKEARDERAV